MNTTMYPSLLGKLIPAFWGYMLAAAADGVVPLANVSNTPNITINNQSVIDVDQRVSLDDWVYDQEGGGEEVDEVEEERYVDSQEYKWLEEEEEEIENEEADWRESGEWVYDYTGYGNVDDDYLVEYEYGEERGVWYGYVMERVYGFDMGKVQYQVPKAMEGTGNQNTPQITMEYIKYGVQANMKIRDQICTAGMVIMSVSCILAMFCVLISCCSGKRTRRVVNESLKEPLLKLDELDRRLAEQNTRPPTAPPLPAVSKNCQALPRGVADGEVIEASSADTGQPKTNIESRTVNYV